MSESIRKTAEAILACEKYDYQAQRAIGIDSLKALAQAYLDTSSGTHYECSYCHRTAVMNPDDVDCDERTHGGWLHDWKPTSTSNP